MGPMPQLFGQRNGNVELPRNPGSFHPKVCNFYVELSLHETPCTFTIATLATTEIVTKKTFIMRIM